jgi:hypothetical protein
MKEGFKLSDFLDDAEDDYLVPCVHFCCAALRWSCLNCLHMFGGSQWKSGWDCCHLCGTVLSE